MNTGIIVQADDFGRVAIPREIRQQFNINGGDSLEVSIDGNTVSFTPCCADVEKQIENIIRTISVNSLEIQQHIDQLKCIADNLGRSGVAVDREKS